MFCITFGCPWIRFCKKNIILELNQNTCNLKVKIFNRKTIERTPPLFLITPVLYTIAFCFAIKFRLSVIYTYFEKCLYIAIYI